MHADAQLVIIELGLGTNGRGHVLEQARSGIGMLMLSMFEGKERIPRELTDLLECAGYQQVQVHQTRSIAQFWAARPGT